jgi:hypothetical protein
MFNYRNQVGFYLLVAFLNEQLVNNIYWYNTYRRGFED